MRRVLIDTQWNVNMITQFYTEWVDTVLIDTQWNVNEIEEDENIEQIMF